MAKSTQKKKKNVKVDSIGEAHIHASFNNIIISLTNKSGQVISWASAGKMGFKFSQGQFCPISQQSSNEIADIFL